MKTPQLKVPIPPDEREIVKAIAKRARTSEAEIVRRMIRRGIGEMQRTAQPAPSAPPQAAAAAQEAQPAA